MSGSTYPVRVTVSARLIQSDIHGTLDVERCRRFVDGLDVVRRRIRNAWIDAAFAEMAHDAEARRDNDGVMRDFENADREAWAMIDD